MKLNLILLSIVCFSALLLSCKKDDVIEEIPIEDDNIENDGVIGKWRLIGTFSSGVFGSNSWEVVPWSSSHSLYLGGIGEYIMQENSDRNFKKCTGTYQLLPDNKMEINSSCQTVIERWSISELTPKRLTLHHMHREGFFEYKYKAVK